MSVALAGSVPARAAGSEVHLPTDADAIAFAPNAQTILFGQAGIETRLPGPVEDEEAITVGLGLDGAPASVRVDQWLTLTGVGDFEFRVPGPAMDVRTLPGSQNEPGLRKGAVLWQGFSSGRKTLAASMNLFPSQEAERLPLRFTLSMRIGGRPVQPGRRLSGPLDLSLRVANVSAIPIGVSVGDADPAALAPVLDAVRRSLLAGRGPRPGTGGVPASVPASGPIRTHTEQIESPFLVEGEIVFPPGSLTGAVVEGAAVSDQADGIHVRFRALLGGGKPTVHAVQARGEANLVGLPVLRVGAVPALPSPSSISPPGAKKWAAAARRSAALEGAAMLEKLSGVLWRVARTAQYRQYLGNPDPGGPSRSSYRFTLAPARPPPSAAVRGPGDRVSPLGLAGLAFLGLALLFLAALAWSRS